MAELKPVARNSKGVPYPQFNTPGSKISPYTGKPYTETEKAKVHQQTLVANSRTRFKVNNAGKTPRTDAIVAASKRRLEARRAENLKPKNKQAGFVGPVASDVVSSATNRPRGRR